MLATAPDRADTYLAHDRAECLVIVPPPTVERNIYAPAPENRIFGLMGTSLLFGLALAGPFRTFEEHFAPPPP